MKDELPNVKMGSGSTVCSEASHGIGIGSGTFARPPPLASRWSENFILRKMEFKGWVTDYSRGSIQGITDSEVQKLVSDLERMVPQQAPKWVDWEKNMELGRRR